MGERLSEEGIVSFQDSLEAKMAGYAASAVRMRDRGLPGSIDAIFPFMASLMARASRDALRVISGELTMDGYLEKLLIVSRSVDMSDVLATQRIGKGSDKCIISEN